MLKQEFFIGQTVRCGSSKFSGVHTVTAVKLKEEEGYRGEPLGETLMYQLDGDNDKWVYGSNLSAYIDEDTVMGTVAWLKQNINKYLYQGERGNLYASEEMYEDLVEHFGLKERLDEV